MMSRKSVEVVFPRRKEILWRSSRKRVLKAPSGFTKEEDEAILRFVEKEGEQWTRLAIMLGRSSYVAVSARYEILINDYKHGDYTAEEDELILREVFAVKGKKVAVKKAQAKQGKIYVGKLKAE